ncbi:hypothetical protein GBA52_003979 [Prunus armeniaca]|nr:hypothetical protein GBA52_003979 [Prunus armeniaca]
MVKQPKQIQNALVCIGQRIGREEIGNPRDEVSSERRISRNAESGNEINDLSCDEVVVEGRETLNERRDEEEGRRWPARQRERERERERERRTRGRVGAVTASPSNYILRACDVKVFEFWRQRISGFITLAGICGNSFKPFYGASLMFCEFGAARVVKLALLPNDGPSSFFFVSECSVRSLIEDWVAS